MASLATSATSENSSGFLLVTGDFGILVVLGLVVGGGSSCGFDSGGNQGFVWVSRGR